MNLELEFSRIFKGFQIEILFFFKQNISNTEISIGETKTIRDQFADRFFSFLNEFFKLPLRDEASAGEKKLFTQDELIKSYKQDLETITDYCFKKIKELREGEKTNKEIIDLIESKLSRYFRKSELLFKEALDNLSPNWSTPQPAETASSKGFTVQVASRDLFFSEYIGQMGLDPRTLRSTRTLRA